MNENSQRFVRMDGTPDFEVASIADRAWNGAVQPSFTRAQADRMAAWMSASDEFMDVEYDAAADAYISRYPDHDENPQEIDTYPVNADGTYSVGAGAWVWEESTFDAEDEADVLANVLSQVSLASNVAEHFTCSEADTVVRFLRAHGLFAQAKTFESIHAMSDESDDWHYALK